MCWLCIVSALAQDPAPASPSAVSPNFTWYKKITAGDTSIYAYSSGLWADMARRNWVRKLVGDSLSKAAHLSGEETFTGTKTFTGQVNFTLNSGKQIDIFQDGASKLAWHSSTSSRQWNISGGDDFIIAAQGGVARYSFKTDGLYFIDKKMLTLEDEVNFVHKTGSENIEGTKNFINNVVVPVVTANNFIHSKGGFGNSTNGFSDWSLGSNNSYVAERFYDPSTPGYNYALKFRKDGNGTLEYGRDADVDANKVGGIFTVYGALRAYNAPVGAKDVLRLGDIDLYVPYTGATDDINAGNYKFKGNLVTKDGGNGVLNIGGNAISNDYSQLNFGTNISAIADDGISVFSKTSYNNTFSTLTNSALNFKQNVTGYTSSIYSDTLTANRYIVLPNKSGTLALDAGLFHTSGNETRSGYFGNIGPAEFAYSGRILTINGPNLINSGNGNRVDLGNGSGIQLLTGGILSINANSTAISGPATFDAVTTSPGYNSTAANGTGGLYMTSQTSRPSTPSAGHAQMFYDANGLSWITPTGFTRSFLGSGLTADRVYTLPDATGTLALTSNPVSTFTNDIGYHTNTTGDARYPQLTSAYSNPSWLTSLLFSKINGVPANSLLGNNTTGSGAALGVPYFDSGEQSYTGAITWTGTAAPSGTSTHSYQWVRLGKQVTLRITLAYTTPGTALTLVTAELPPDLPIPHTITGFAAGDMNYMGWGGFSVSKTNSLTTAGRLSLRLTGGAYKATCAQTSGDYLVAQLNFVYYTD